MPFLTWRNEVTKLPASVKILDADRGRLILIFQ